MLFHTMPYYSINRDTPKLLATVQNSWGLFELSHGLRLGFGGLGLGKICQPVTGCGLVQTSSKFPTILALQPLLSSER